jgi:hypothetical protein
MRLDSTPKVCWTSPVLGMLAALVGASKRGRQLTQVTQLLFLHQASVLSLGFVDKCSAVRKLVCMLSTYLWHAG